MIHDSHDPYAELRHIVTRIRHLETASPLEHSSISRGGITIYVPGEPGGETGQYGPSTAVARIGHADGKVGVLLPGSGGAWVTVQDHIDARIVTSHEYPNARLNSLELFANTYGPTVNDLVTDMDAVPGLIAASHTYPNNRIGDLEGRMGTAESNIDGKASVSSVATAQSRADSAWNLANSKASQSKLNEVIDAINDLEAYVRSQHPGKISVPPIVKG